MTITMKVLKQFSGRKKGEKFEASRRDVKSLEAFGFAERYETRQLAADSDVGDSELDTRKRSRRRYGRRDMTAQE